MKKIALVLGTIGLLMGLWILDAGMIYMFGLSSNDVRTLCVYQCIGCTIALIFAMISFLFSIVSIMKSDKNEKDKKAIVLLFVVSAFFAFVCDFVSNSYIVYVLGIIIGAILFLFAVEKILSINQEKIEKIILIISLIIAIVAINLSLSEFITQVGTLNGYINSSIRKDNQSLDEKLWNYKYDKFNASQIWWNFQNLNRKLNKITNDYNKEFNTNFSTNDIINKYCKTSEKVEITTKQEAGKVVYGEITKYMAFNDDSKEYYKTNFGGELLDLFRKSNIELEGVLGYDSKYLEYIVVDENGNLYINPSSLLYNESK